MESKFVKIKPKSKIWVDEASNFSLNSSIPSVAKKRDNISKSDDQTIKAIVDRIGCNSTNTTIVCTECNIQNFEHLWIIENFCLHLQSPNLVVGLTSPSFVIQTNPSSEWRIICYPKGHSEKPNSYPAVQLEHIKGENPVKLNAQYRIFTGTTNASESNQWRTSHNHRNRYAYENDYSSEEIESDEMLNYLTADGSLIIRVSISTVGHSKSKDINFLDDGLMIHKVENPVSLLPSDKLFRDFGSMLINCKDSYDVVFEITDSLKNESSSDTVPDNVEDYTTKLYAHRLILMARSKVFAAMFNWNKDEEERKTDTTEPSREIKVVINDTDADTFQNMLSFIYTSTFENTSKCNWLQLLKVSDKYELTDLRQVCEREIADNLNVENVCEILTHAYMHSISTLYRKALTYTLKNMSTVLKSDGWLKYVANCPSILNDLIKTNYKIFSK
ncbi:hypothetical protein GJ496_004145 [Pomphorhynchus laevis]|nr:hypothetical protein GJ496_004145 [Pomphorhynchus laevis]